jgi:hypothetical protein
MSQVGQHEPWAIRLAGDEATRKAGDNLRQWAGDDRGAFRRFMDRVLDKDDADPKLAGLMGEELVGKELAKLGDAWTVLHGVRGGPKADVDHLVLGPGGVFCLNTKRLDHDADVTVTARQFRVNGYSRPYYPKAVKEASRVEVRLQAAAGWQVPVRPVLVVCNVNISNVRVREQPDDVTVVFRRDVLRWLRSQVATLAPELLAMLVRKARHPSTWDPTKTDEILDVVPTPIAAEPEKTSAADTTVVRWRRYGHDRTYVNDAATGQRLGWRDEKTREVHIEDEQDAARVRAALVAHAAE